MKRLNTVKDIELYGLKRLTGQEWSVFLLKKKMLDRTDCPALIDEAINNLIEDGWLSDERFTECYVRSTRDNKGYGPMKVKARLTEKGINSDLISKHLYENHPIWSRNAFNIRMKKYGDVPSDIKEKSKQMNFLQSRGFTFSQIQFSMKDKLPEFYNEIIPPEEDKDGISLEELISHL